MLKWLGEKRIPRAMGITGYLVSIPVFVDVAYIVLQPTWNWLIQFQFHYGSIKRQTAFGIPNYTTVCNISIPLWFD